MLTRSSPTIATTKPVTSGGRELLQAFRHKPGEHGFKKCPRKGRSCRKPKKGRQSCPPKWKRRDRRDRTKTDWQIPRADGAPGSEGLQDGRHARGDHRLNADHRGCFQTGSADARGYHNYKNPPHRHDKRHVCRPITIVSGRGGASSARISPDWLVLRAIWVRSSGKDAAAAAAFTISCSIPGERNGASETIGGSSSESPPGSPFRIVRQSEMLSLKNIYLRH